MQVKCIRIGLSYLVATSVHWYRKTAVFAIKTSESPILISKPKDKWVIVDYDNTNY